MRDREQYTPGPASAVQFCRFWSAHVDALERHLSAKTWALAAVTVVLMAYPIARIVIPAILHGIVPDVVRTVLNFDLSSTCALRQKSYVRRVRS